MRWGTVTRDHSGSSMTRCVQYKSAVSLAWDGYSKGTVVLLSLATGCCILLRTHFFKRSKRKIA